MLQLISEFLFPLVLHSHACMFVSSSPSSSSSHGYLSDILRPVQPYTNIGQEKLEKQETRFTPLRRSPLFFSRPTHVFLKYPLEMSGCPFATQQPSKGLDNAVESAIRSQVVNFKVNACPMAVRLAWHASGTFDGEAGVGGSDGATMRFEQEASDGANAGLNIMRDLLKPVKAKFPFVSKADIWARAGAFAVKMLSLIHI